MDIPHYDHKKRFIECGKKKRLNGITMGHQNSYVFLFYTSYSDQYKL